MKCVIQSVGESLCPPQSELAVAEDAKVKHDSKNLKEYMKDQVQQMYNQ